MTLIDMDRNPNDREWGEEIPKDASVNVPERPMHDALRGGGGGVPAAAPVAVAAVGAALSAG